MCLALPGKLTAITGQLDETFRFGKVSFGGIMKDVNLSMVPEANVGDYILVHVGVAISVVDEDEALKTFEYIRQIGELNELQPDERTPGDHQAADHSKRSDAQEKEPRIN